MNTIGYKPLAYKKLHAGDIPTFTVKETFNKRSKDSVLTVFGGRSMFGNLLTQEHAESFGFTDGLGSLYMKGLADSIAGMSQSYQLSLENYDLNELGDKKINEIYREFNEQGSFNKYFETPVSFSLQGKSMRPEIIENIRAGDPFIMTTMQTDLLRNLKQDAAEYAALPFHDKNYFADYLKNKQYFTTPKTVAIKHANESFTYENIHPNENTNAVKLLQQYAYDTLKTDPSDVFVKLSVLGGGFGVAGLDDEQGVRRLFGMYDTHRFDSTFNQGLQIQQAVIQPEQGKDSPCLTSDHLTNGDMDILSSSQILQGPVYLGNQFDNNAHQQLLEALGNPLNDYLKDLLDRSVYFGGTDFMKNNEGVYENIVDPNYGRYNGSTAMRYIKNLLEYSGATVNSAFTSKLLFKTRDFGAINKLLEKYTFDGTAGIIIIPNAVGAFYGLDATEIKIVYVNNSQDDAFSSFQNEIIEKYTKKPVL